MEDEKIIQLFWERKESAIEELKQKYGTFCTKIANNILNNREDAEECVNDAYLGAWNNIPPEKPNPLRTYICRIVRNQAIKRYHANRAKKRNSVYDVALEELENCIPAVGTVEEQWNAKEVARSIDAFLECLDRENRILFVRRYWYGESVPDLAGLFQISSHNVTVRLSRIREKLKKHLKKEGIWL